MLNRLGCCFLAIGGVSLAIACGSPTLQGYSPPPPTSSASDSTQPTQSPPVAACDPNAPAPDAGTPWPCPVTFSSGVNVAWINFANDVPNPQLPMFDALFSAVSASGGRVARWWFHTNGMATPGYDSSGMALPISCSDIADVKHILDSAHAAGVMVNISLWSFDMLKSLSPTLMTNNKNLLSVDANRQAYIDNVLTPLVTALKGYPGLYSYEIFNEPEGMSTGSPFWSPFTGAKGTSVDVSLIQKTVNWFAAAIHAADPDARVTNGAWSFPALSAATGANYYSDQALMAAGGTNSELDLTKGTLDFYEVHYYTSDGTKNSPFVNPRSNWGLDKPVVVGEFYALDQTASDGGVVAAADTYTALHDGGYAGAWAWQYEHDDCTGSSPQCNTKWPAMQPPMQSLFAAAPEDVSCP